MAKKVKKTNVNGMMMKGPMMMKNMPPKGMGPKIMKNANIKKGKKAKKGY